MPLVGHIKDFAKRKKYPPLQRRTHFIIGLIWICTLGFECFLANNIYQSYGAHLQSQHDQVQFAVRLAESQALLTFDRANQLLLETVEHVLPSDMARGNGIAPARRRALELMLKEHQVRFPAIVSMTLTDAEGTIFANSVGGANGGSLAYRQYFQFLKQGAGDGPSLSEALKGRVSEKWGVQIARRIEFPDGTFAGMLVANLGLDEGFIGFYQTLKMEHDDVVTLIDANALQMVRYPVAEQSLGKVINSPALSDMLNRGVTEKWAVLESPVDGIRRTWVFRKLPNYPVHIGYGRGVKGDMDVLRRQELQGIVGGVLALCAAVVLTIGLRRLMTARSEIDAAAYMLRMAEANRLESLGTLAGGVAHEINTPAQYIKDNLDFIIDWLPRLLGLLKLAQATEDFRMKEYAGEMRYDFAARELPAAAEQARGGIEQISSIVQAIKEFSYPSNKTPQPFDLNRAVRIATTVTRNQWKYAANLEFHLDADLPHVSGIESEINQVLVNLIVNATHAIEEKGGGELGRIDIQTHSKGGGVELSVADTGTGIAQENLDHLFELFFTTKEPGKGTGQGLAISRAIILRHGGTITAESKPGSGACFRVWLPAVADAAQFSGHAPSPSISCPQEI